MKTYICIVARLSSSRLPKKALMKLVGDLTMLEVLIKYPETQKVAWELVQILKKDGVI